MLTAAPVIGVIDGLHAQREWFLVPLDAIDDAVRRISTTLKTVARAQFNPIAV